MTDAFFLPAHGGKRRLLVPESPPFAKASAWQAAHGGKREFMGHINQLLNPVRYKPFLSETNQLAIGRNLISSQELKNIHLNMKSPLTTKTVSDNSVFHGGLS